MHIHTYTYIYMYTYMLTHLHVKFCAFYRSIELAFLLPVVVTNLILLS
jgi:hypothetical protein